MDLLRPLGLAAIPCAVAPRWDTAVRHSRFAQIEIDGVLGHVPDDVLVERLERFGATQSERPVLFYENDSDLLTLSRHRERLARHFRFQLPDADTLESLVDKSRFQELAGRLELPVPRGCRLPVDLGSIADLELEAPFIVKPFKRGSAWDRLAAGEKAVRIDDDGALRRLVAQARDAGLELLGQELIPGPESRIESYHAWVRADGSVAGEFTGRKIRTIPPQAGHSTALEVTNVADVRALGREIVGRVGLSGAVKLDFKRGRDDGLRLLEINPRFSLWVNVGAAAGVNLPAVSYFDLVGQTPPDPPAAASGTTWCRPIADFRAARAHGVSAVEWARWTLRADVKSAFDWDDPGPLLSRVARKARRVPPRVLRRRPAFR